MLESLAGEVDEVMDFSSPLFLFLFLPIVLGSYWICSAKIRTYFLLAASLFFYVWGEGIHVLVLCLLIAANYLLTLSMSSCQERSRRLPILFGTIVFNLALLFTFKYPGLGLNAPTTVHLPLGLSFLTFQAIAYAIDVYHRKHTPTLNPVPMSLFFALFPKVSAGPIIRYDEVEQTLINPIVNIDDCAYGAKRFIFGMGKKLILADTLAQAADQIFAIPTGELTTPLAWLGIVCYTLQLYFDFSGYSDMAIGLGKMLGFKLRENFDYPYTAKSLTEFWRRWHLSLSTWFRDYLYTPLLYSLTTDSVREKVARGKYQTNYLSLFCIIFVFALCGWWHGPTWNFVLWGLLHGFILAAESWKLGRLLKKAPSFVSHGYALLVIMLCWVFFRSPTVGEALSFINTLVGLGSRTGSTYSLSRYLNGELLLVLIVSIVASMPSARYFRERIAISSPTFSRSWPSTVMEIGTVAVVFLISLMSVASSTYKPFIYFRF